MSEAMGGAIGLKLIAFLIVVITSYLAFTTIYSKAFRIKSDIVSIIEKNDGIKDYVSPDSTYYTTGTIEEIKVMLEKENYNIGMNISCPENALYKDYAICIECIQTSGGLNGVYYRVRTFVDAPNLLGLGKLFRGFINISGETKVIYNSELRCQ